MSWVFHFVRRASRGPGMSWALLLLLALVSIPCRAQTDTPDTSGDSSSASGTPGSPDSPSPSGVPEDGDASPAKPYGGPSLLGRDFSSSLGLPQINLTPFVEISGVYDSGLYGVVINSQGGGKSPAGFGTQYSLGLTGAHSWRYSQLTFAYSGSTNRYFVANASSSSSQALTLRYIRMFSRRTKLSVNEAASAFTRSFTEPTISSSYVPALDVYGNRTSSFSTQIALVHQRSARLSFSVSGNGGLTHQASTVVYDIGSVGAMADAQYRLSMRSTAGVSYSFSHYIYPGSFSSTEYHSVNGNFALALSRRTEFSFSAGFLRSQSRYLQIIPLAPLFAYLTGSSTAAVIHRQVAQRPSGSGRFTRSFSKSSVSFSGGYTVVPGNGLFLATIATTFSGGFSYTGLRRWGLNAGGSYSEGKSIGTSLGQYGTYGASVSASRPIGRLTHAVVSFSTTKYNSASVSYYNRLIYQVRIGLGFSPGNLPLGPR
jgi:hypothetical protein